MNEKYNLDKELNDKVLHLDDEEWRTDWAIGEAILGGLVSGVIGATVTVVGGLFNYFGANQGNFTESISDFLPYGVGTVAGLCMVSTLPYIYHKAKVVKLRKEIDKLYALEN